MKTWTCIQNCGACCHLEPSERPELDSYLSPTELEQYLSFVGEGGWCIHFDRRQRQCRIYADRPDFCRVRPDTFKKMYGIEPEVFDEFAIDCCHQQIEWLYGPDSAEMERYDRAVEKSAVE